MKIQNNLSRRLGNYAVQIILFSRKWPVEKEFEIIKHQIIKSATSPGANYEEAQAAGTRPDFHNKINISLKEMRESIYWLRIIDDLNNSEISKT